MPLFESLRRISLRHWPSRLFVDLYYDHERFARLYRDGSYEIFPR